MNAFDERELNLYCESKGLVYEIDSSYGLVYFERKQYRGNDMNRILEDCFEYGDKPKSYTFTLGEIRHSTASRIISMLEEVLG